VSPSVSKGIPRESAAFPLRVECIVLGLIAIRQDPQRPLPRAAPLRLVVATQGTVLPADDVADDVADDACL
jgi:hypothetical protein